MDDDIADPIVIAVALDGRYVPWAATLLRSCLRSNPESRLCFEIVHDGSLSDEDRSRLASLATTGLSSVRFHSIALDHFAHLPTTPLFGRIVWLRFRLPELLSDRARVLYLDSDTLVMSDLRSLWNTSLDPHALGAVANVVEPAARAHVRDLGIQYPGGLFNSGVLLMDLARMRSEHSSEALLETAAALGEKLIWPDQDALNVVYARRWVALHPRWNAQNSFWAWRPWAGEVFDESALEEAMSGPGVRHFEGPGISKPWHYLCPYPGRKEYRACLAETPWAGTPLLDKTAATRLIRLFHGERRYRAYARLLRTRRRFRR